MKKLIQKIKDGTAAQILKELRWISGYGRQYFGVILWNIFLGIIGTVLGLAASIVSKNLIDIVTGYQTGYIIWAAVAFVVMQLVQIGLSALTGRISAKLRLQVSQSLRADVFHKILRAQWEPLSRYHSGDLMTRASKDVDAVAGSVIGWVPSLIVNSIQLVGTFLVVFWFDSTLAFLTLITAPITLLVSGFLSKRIRKYSKQMREIGSEMASFHAETFQNISFIKSFHAVETYRQKLAQHQNHQKDVTLEHNRFSILTSSFLSLVGMAVGGICFFWSVYRLWNDHITFGEMTMFLQLSGSLSGAFSALVSLIPAAITAATSAGRIMEVTQLPSEDVTPPETLAQLQKVSDQGVQVTAENVSFTYESRKNVFQNVHLQADAGQIVALVGPSGGGKTTMLRLLLGLIHPQDGTLRLSSHDGAVSLDISPATRCLFSYVPQKNTLFSGTIEENLRLANPEAIDEQLTEALQVACAYDFVSNLPDGLGTYIGERGTGLSEGQIQRLSIARALLSDAPVLLLDEATSALDTRTARELLHNITSFQKNRTCIITTHKPSVLEICDRVYRIDDRTVLPVDPETL